MSGVYWDASAIMSVLSEDRHSTSALSVFDRRSLHIISTLALAEAYATIGRLLRNHDVDEAASLAMRQQLHKGPWSRTTMHPNEQYLETLSRDWPLRGADLWHLALTKTLRDDLEDVVMVTFDHRLLEAARGEHVALS